MDWMKPIHIIKGKQSQVTIDVNIYNRPSQQPLD